MAWTASKIQVMLGIKWIKTTQSLMFEFTTMCQVAQSSGGLIEIELCFSGGKHS